MYLGNLALIALAVLLTACSPCGSNDDAVALARNMSPERLAQLFRDVESLSPLSGQGQIHLDTRTGIPDAFKDLDPQSITRDEDMARVHLSGCADDKVLLHVKGIGNNGRKEISLLPGEANQPVLLWQSD